MSTAHPPAPPPPGRFLIALALANAGGVIGWLPLISLLLPLRAEAVAGAARVEVLSIAAIAGAVAASASNLLFGWLSDRSLARGGGRRRWIALGALLMLPACAMIALATRPATLVLAVVAFQIAVNALIAPIAALLADEVPDHAKGVAGGLFSLGSPVASAMTALLIALPEYGGLGWAEGARIMAVPVLVALFVLPVLRIRGVPVAVVPDDADRGAIVRRRFSAAWVARLLLQVAGAATSIYLLFYFRTLPGGDDPALATHVAGVLTVAFLLPVPIAILAGRLSDRSGRREPFLLAAAVVAAAGLVGMATANGFATGAAAFALYIAGTAVFLSLHTAHAAELLPRRGHRGRDLGMMNLTNTLPSLAAPVLAWWLATPDDFDAVLVVLAALTLAGGAIVMIPRRQIFQ